MKSPLIALLFVLLSGCGAGLEEVDDRPVVAAPEICSPSHPENCPLPKPTI
jgi:hypothetical protein